jgi:hypothetical protein
MVVKFAAGRPTSSLPLLAVIGGWLLAGREPSAIGRRPLG